MGKSNASHSCMKRAADVAIAINSARKMGRIVGDQAHGRPSTRMNAVIMPTPTWGRSQARVFICNGVNDLADVIDAKPAFRHRKSELALVITFPVRQGTLEVGKQLFGHLHGFSLVLHRNIDDTVRNLHGHGPHLVRGEDAKAAALDHGWPANTNVAVLGGDDNVTATQQHRVTRKQRPVVIPMRGTRPLISA